LAILADPLLFSAGRSSLQQQQQLQQGSGTEGMSAFESAFGAATVVRRPQGETDGAMEVRTPS